AHIDGLRVAGDPGWEICLEELAWEEPGEIFTAAILALESGDEERIQTVLQKCEPDVELYQGFISALGWLSFEQVEPFLQRFLKNDSPEIQRIGIAGFAIHRQDPGETLQNALQSDDPRLLSRALKAIGELGKQSWAGSVVPFFDHENSEVRYHAAWSGILLGESEARKVLKSFAEADGPRSKSAAAMAVRTGRIDGNREWFQNLAGKEEHKRKAIIAAGALGDPADVPWIIEQMATPELARVAGESLSMITGLDIAYEDLEAEPPENFEAGPTEDPADDDVDLDPDEDLPWPDPAAIDRWWAENRKSFKKGSRHLCGRPIAKKQLWEVLKTGYQRQRAAAAIELSLLEPGKPLFNVKAPAKRQMRMLGLK
ncbi:MAG: TIGR02270 family protein, partial [Desulfococcaceae bacterium]